MKTTTIGRGNVGGEPFAQHPRLAELVNSLHFRRYPLFLAGLLYEEPGGPLRRAIAVASRDGDLLAYDGGQVFEHPGRVPASRLFDDDDPGDRSEKALVDALAALNQAFFAHEVAAWTKGRRSINEVGIALLHHLVAPDARMDGVLGKLQDGEAGRVLVVHAGEVVGIITPWDLTRWLRRWRELAGSRRG